MLYKTTRDITHNLKHYTTNHTFSTGDFSEEYLNYLLLYGGLELIEPEEKGEPTQPESIPEPQLITNPAAFCGRCNGKNVTRTRLIHKAGKKGLVQVINFCNDCQIKTMAWEKD